MKRICIAFNPCLQLRGDVLIKCYNKKQNSATRDVIFRCQFHTCAISDYVLNFTKSELDDACEGALFIYFPRAVPVLTYGREFFTCFTCLSVILFTAVKSRISYYTLGCVRIGRLRLRKWRRWNGRCWFTWHFMANFAVLLVLLFAQYK